jgi:hypothetical protein
MAKLDSRLVKLEARRPNRFEPVRGAILGENDPEPVAAPGERWLIIRLVGPQTVRMAPGRADDVESRGVDDANATTPDSA